MKTCRRCLETKQDDDFYVDRGALRAACKACIQRARLGYYITHREQSLAAAARYAHAPNGKAKRKAWLRVRAKTKTFVEYQKRWSLSPKGQASRRNRVNRFAQTAKGKAANKRRSARRRSNIENMVATLTAEQWSAILVAHEFKCAYCKKPFSQDLPPTQDHIIPVSKGGNHTKENILPSCRSCNSRKGNRVYDHY